MLPVGGVTSKLFVFDFHKLYKGLLVSHVAVRNNLVRLSVPRLLQSEL